MSKEIVPRLRVNAQENGNDNNDSPGQNCGQAGIFANHGEKLSRRLASGDTPRNRGSSSGSERKSQQLARKPPFYFRPGFFPNKIVPDQ